MKKEDFDELMQLLQNPTRRKILEILSREEHYPLQISRNLNTSQQAVSKHLKTMERHGIVISRSSKSERGGPPTKTYSLNSEFSVRIDLGPSLFETEVEKLEGEDVCCYQELEDKISESDEDSFLEDRREVIQEIDSEIQDLERKRIHLLKLKEKALGQAFEHIHKNFEDYWERNLLYYVIKSGETDPEKIARELRVREEEVKELIDKIKERTDIW
ncbi:MAG: ArsR/SmtB family transcription factor [Thermoplasmatota archaeon]